MLYEILEAQDITITIFSYCGNPTIYSEMRKIDNIARTRLEQRDWVVLIVSSGMTRARSRGHCNCGDSLRVELVKRLDWPLRIKCAWQAFSLAFHRRLNDQPVELAYRPSINAFSKALCSSEKFIHAGAEPREKDGQGKGCQRSESSGQSSHLKRFSKC